MPVWGVYVDNNWSCQVFNIDFLFILIVLFILLPHWRVTQRQDPHEVKCLDIQFYHSLATVVHRLLLSVIADAPHQSPGICPKPLAKLRHVLRPNTATVFWLHYRNMAVGDNDAHLCFCWRDKVRSSGGVGWSEVLCHLVRFMVALLLVFNLCFYVQFELMGTLRRSTSKTQAKPIAWSDAYKCFFFFFFLFFFCLLNEMCYFALSLPTHTFLKQQIMWMFTVNGLVFFFLLLLSKNLNDLWAF